MSRSCFVSQRYWKMKAIHNILNNAQLSNKVVLYPKDTEKWKQFTTGSPLSSWAIKLFCIPKILKNESNSQLSFFIYANLQCCFVSQRYWKMKAIHNYMSLTLVSGSVVLYPKDTEKWKQFTTLPLKPFNFSCCFVSQRYWKMKSSKGKARRFGVAKAIHNAREDIDKNLSVVLYPKDTEKWKQFTTKGFRRYWKRMLFCIPKILKNEI